MPPRSRQASPEYIVNPTPHPYNEIEQVQVARMAEAGISRDLIVDYYEQGKAGAFLGKAIDHLEVKAGMGRNEAARTIWKEVLQHACQTPGPATDTKLKQWSDKSLFAVLKIEADGWRRARAGVKYRAP